MGMKLKSGADLCGFELSRFCVQNDVAIPDAPASGRKYFHTGTGMEGKYSLLGRERIFTGAAWRSAAYVDDLANLDLATNADYLALKERVDAFLDGEVDSNGVLDNLKEIQKFLDNYSSATDLTAILDTKLDKSGGTITHTGDSGLKLSASNGSANYLWFEGILNDSKNLLGGFGMKGYNNPVYVSPTGITYTLIHSDNIEDYAITTKKWLEDDDIPLNTTGMWTNHGGYLSAGWSASYKMVFLTATNGINVRIIHGSSDTDWKTIAFTDSTVEAAKKLETPRTIWGQSFDGTGNVNGDITMNNYTAIKFKNAAGTSALNEMMVDSNNYLTIGYDQAANSLLTKIDGSSIYLRYGTSHTTGLILNSSGNVTIGASDKAGTYYKLYVEGAAKAVGGLLTTNLAIECDENGVQAGYFSEINHVKGGNLYLQVRQGDLILSHVNGATTIRGTLSVAGYTAINNSLTVSNNIVANGTIACKGVAAAGSAPVGTVDKWAGSIASGTKSQTYTHGLGTTDITVAIYEKNGNEWVQILTDVDIVNANTIRVTFGANTTVEHRIVVMG